MLRYIFTLLHGSGRKTITDEEAVAEYLKSQNDYFFEILYNRYSAKVFGKALTILKEANLAQDATQDIMMKVLLNLSKFKGNSKFSTWLYSITYNFCIDFYRKRQKRHTLLTENINQYEDLEEEYDDKEILEVKIDQLKEIMAEIPITDKAILMMKYLDGMSIKEISATLEKTESAVKMKIKRAKHKFVRVHRERFTQSQYI